HRLLHCTLTCHPLPSFPTRRSSDLSGRFGEFPELLEGAARVPPVGNIAFRRQVWKLHDSDGRRRVQQGLRFRCRVFSACFIVVRSEEHTSELQSRFDLVCRLLLEKK